MKKAFVIIPTYNEKENVVKVIAVLNDAFKKVQGWQMGILVVDDTSPDKTYEVVEELRKTHKHLSLLINKQKAGLGAAYLKGMEYAFNTLGADVIIEFDADLSHDSTKIPQMLAKIDEGYDLVLGSRYVKGGGIPDDWGLHRKLLSVVGNMVVMTILTNFTIHDWTAGYRALTKEVYTAVEPEMHGEQFSGYTFQVGFLHKAVTKGFKIAEVPYKFVDRQIGYSKIGPEYIENLLKYLFQARFQEIIGSRIFKFAVVGGIGASIQLSSLFVLYRLAQLPYQLAFFLAIEIAVASNFAVNNAWTFSDRKLELSELPSSFLKFNLASAGSILIQQALALFGQFVIGLFTLFTLPIIGIGITTGMLYAVIGILLGMFWNFFAYNAFIWKKQPAVKTA